MRSILVHCALLVVGTALTTRASADDQAGVSIDAKMTKKAASQGQNLAVKVTIRSTNERTHRFRLGSLPQVFGVYILGPWGHVAPDVTKVRPENWMHQEHSASRIVSITPQQPYQATINLNDYFPVTDAKVFKPGRYQVNIKFYDVTLGMKTPVDSGSLVFRITEAQSAR
jgi:hypothetical protein